MTRTLAVAVALVAAALACSQPMPMTKTVKIGVVIDRTGTNAEPSWGDAIKLAEKHANAALTKAGKNWRMSFELSDSQNSPTVAVERATSLVKTDGVKGLILDTSQNDLAINKLHYDADQTNDPNVPLMCGGCTSSAINNPNATAANMEDQLTNRNGLGWNFRGLMSTTLVSLVLVKDMLRTNNGDANMDGKFKIALYGGDESFGRTTNADIKRFANTLRPMPAPLFKEVLHSPSAAADTYNWAGDIAKLLEQTSSLPDGGTTPDMAVPDYVTVANFAQYQSATIRAYKTGNNTPKMLHLQSLRINSVLSGLGNLAEGSEGVSHVLIDNAESGDLFRTEFEKEFGRGIAYRDSIYYDIATSYVLGAMYAVQGQMDADQITGANVRDGIRKISDMAGETIRTGPDEFGKALTAIAANKTLNYFGASGNLDFDANQTVRSRLAKFAVQGGKFVDVQKFDCIKDDNCDVIP